jgi:flagellar M-ring protein FliF
MRDRFLHLWEKFLVADVATKITLILSTIMIVGVVTVGSWFAGKADFVEHFTGLSASQAAAYKAALAEAGIPFKSGPPPGPFSIWVDSADTIRAEAQVARGGFQPESKGIQVSSGGAQSAFLSAGERDLMMNKREWQECEKLLETLDFVDRATVVGSKSQHSPFRRDVPPTIAVSLGLRYGLTLSDAEARNVATLVRGRFNVPMENITILDESANLLHDGGDLASGGRGSDLFEQQRKFDAQAERKANHQLALALGQGMASVTVSTDWTFDETETVKDVPLKGAETYKSKTEDTVSAPSSGAVGGAAGVSSNITQDFGNQNAGIEGGASSSPLSESTTEESRNAVGRETQHRVSRAPEIRRMSIALVVDQSVPAEKLTGLDEMVKAAVGFQQERDEFKSFQYALASIERDEEGNPVPVEAPEPVEEPNAYVTLMMTHGIEVLAALAFVTILLRSLRGASATKREIKQAEVAAATVIAEEEAAAAAIEEELANMDPELLARMRVEQLVREEPERVSEILTQWAAEELTTVGAGQ